MDIFKSPSNRGPTAYQQSLKLLSRRNYSRAKLQEKLQSLNFNQDEIESALNEVIQKGYLNEDLYLSGKISRMIEQGFSIKFIQKKLEFENLIADMETIESVFKKKGETEVTQIQKIIHKKLQSNQNISQQKKLKNKILSALIRRGHQLSLCQSELHRIFFQHR